MYVCMYVCMYVRMCVALNSNAYVVYTHSVNRFGVRERFNGNQQIS